MHMATQFTSRKTKKQYDRHKEGSKTMNVWVDDDWKEELKREAEENKAYLSNWTLSDHIRFIVDDYRGRWDKQYRPIQYTSRKNNRG